MNAFLHPLTNRGQGYIWPRFPVDPHWVARGSDEADEVRRLMRLNVTDCDWYVVGCLQAIAGCPWVAREIADTAALMTMLHYVPSTGSIVGADLRPDQKGPPQLVRTSMLWPVDFWITLTRVDEGHALLKVDGMPAAVSARFDDTYLHVDWPESVGIAGALVPTSWAASDEILIYHEPRRFPYELLAQELHGVRAHDRLLLTTGLASHAVAARSDLEKIAVTCLALIRDYHAHG